MSSSLDINGKKMLSIKPASEQAGYSRDYVTKLAREGKIVASQIGRNWFVDVESLQQYAGIMATEQKFRQQQLSEERKRERQVKEAVEKKVQDQGLYRRRLARQSKVLACGVLLLGLATGFALQRLPLVSTEITRQVTSAPLVAQVSGKPETTLLDAGTVPVDSSGAEALNFSHEGFRLSTLSESSQGILILPNASTTGGLDPTELFSDEVQILTDENGATFVARVNEKSEVIEKIPFVVVPVINKKTP